MRFTGLRELRRLPSAATAALTDVQATTADLQEHAHHALDDAQRAAQLVSLAAIVFTGVVVGVFVYQLARP